MCDTIYIGNTQQTFFLIDSHFSDLLSLLKNGQKTDSFAAHFKQHFNTTTSRTDLHKYMTFKVVNQLNPIVSMKTFTKPNCNLCIEERLTILKKLRDKHVTITNKNSEIYEAFRHTTTFKQKKSSTLDKDNVMLIPGDVSAHVIMECTLGNNIKMRKIYFAGWDR